MSNNNPPLSNGAPGQTQTTPMRSNAAGTANSNNPNRNPIRSDTSTSSFSTTATNASRNVVSAPLVLRHLSFEADTFHAHEKEGAGENIEDDDTLGMDLGVDMRITSFPENEGIINNSVPSNVGGNQTTPMYLPPPRSRRPKRMQGVLWKRRDVFTAQWRPRWFVLHPRRGTLTYYLMTNPASPSGASNSTSPSIPPLRQSTDAFGSIRGTPPPIPAPSFNRNRTLSESSNVSENTVDYDVVPRGSIVLQPNGRPCQVSINSVLTRPSEDLYAFSVTTPPPNAKTVNLAARSNASRREWMNGIDQVCKYGLNINGPSRNGLPATLPRADSLPTPSSAPTRGSTWTRDGRSRESGRSPQPPSLQQQPTRPPTTISTSTTAPIRPTETQAPSPPSIPPSLSTKFDTICEAFLPMCADHSKIHDSSWTVLVKNNTAISGVSAFTKPMPGRPDLQLLKSQACIPHSARRIAALLLDISKRPQLEVNIRTTKRAHVYNATTFLDYFAFHGQWPTAAREFAFATHWRIIESPDADSSSPAIVIVSSSCPEAAERIPSPPDHVRGELLLSLYLLEPKTKPGQSQPHCQLTRLLCYDLCGKIPKRFIKNVLIQQSHMPHTLNMFLSVPANQHQLDNDDGSFDQQSIVRDIEKHILKRGVAASPADVRSVDAGNGRRRKRISFASDEPLVTSSTQPEDATRSTDEAAAPGLANGDPPSTKSVASTSTFASAIRPYEPDAESSGNMERVIFLASPMIMYYAIETGYVTVLGSRSDTVFLALAALVAFLIVKSVSSLSAKMAPPSLDGPTSIVTVTSVLFFPLYMYFIVLSGRNTSKGWARVFWAAFSRDAIFLVVAWFATKWVCEARLGRCLLRRSRSLAEFSLSSGCPVLESCTLECEIPLSSENTESKSALDTATIALVVAKSLLKSQEYHNLLAQHIQYPLLLIDGYYLSADIQLGLLRNQQKEITRVPLTEIGTMQSIDKAQLSTYQQREHEENMPACLILEKDQKQEQREPSPWKIHSLAFQNVPLVVAVSSTATSTHLELTFQQPLTSLQICEAFADEVRKGIQNSLTASTNST